MRGEVTSVKEAFNGKEIRHLCRRLDGAPG